MHADPDPQPCSEPFAKLFLSVNHVPRKQFCGAGPILTGSGSCGRLRKILSTQILIKNTVFKKYLKYFTFLKVYGTYFSFNLCI